MRTLLFALVGGSVLCAGAVVGLRLNSSALAAIEVARPALVERFVMQASGDEQSCFVEKAQGAGPLSHIVIAPDCDAMLPGLSSLHYWSEGADGTVTLSADGRTPAVIFAEADGVAYESIEPKTPLIALIAGD